MVSIINSSLVNGIVPSCLKHAIIQPLLKKPRLDPLDLNNYRPISKLPFSKILEKAVYHQLISFLNKNSVLDKFQSGFRSKYSTETALLKVHNDLMLAADSGKGAILILLDLTAAFDTIDHDILLNRLSQWVGIRGNALKWFCSYLKDRSSVVQLGNYVSDSAAYFCGVPQGSILGPILFSLYMLPLGFICRKYSVAYHLYADDAQLCLPLNAGDCDELGGLMAC